MTNGSYSPDGVFYPFPTKEESQKEAEVLENITVEEKRKGREIVAVQGLGFVGCIMAAVIADAEDEDGNPYYFVHGVQRPSARSYWKIPVINEGKPPVESTDPDVPEIFRKTVVEKKTLHATWHEKAYELADIVVVDIQLDATKPSFGSAEIGYCDTGAFEAAIKQLGEHIKPDCLVLVETTVPPGTCKNIVKPILEEEFKKRGIDVKKNPPRIAHSYERVMPGANYVTSIRDFWRVYAGIDKEAGDRAEIFLKRVLNTRKYPLSRLGDTNASELAKTMENSFRATNIAFVYEWTLLAEEIGINLWEVINAIRVRPTHRNIMAPGLGVGGYCLTKDPVLAHWAYKDIFKLKRANNDSVLGHWKTWEKFKEHVGLPMTVESVNINDLMPLHTADLTREALGGNLAKQKVLILGASYLRDVGDTRHSPSEILWHALKERGALPSVHDPLVKVWPEIPSAKVEKDLWESMKGKDAIIFAVGHREYLGLPPEKVVEAVGKPCAIVDTQNILNDEEIKAYLKLGCEVKGVGKGHIRYLKEEVERSGRL
ncbi:MAG: nucleotide sugar dehydrogenase [Caldiserica bacterium]|nr:nucleotide sugar dehydrogenase [Caldisericota bacterium]